MSKFIHFTRNLPEIIWAPISTSLIITFPGILSIIFSQPWFFPSLATIAYMQSRKPGEKASVIFDVLTGQYIGIGSAFAGLFIFGAENSPELFTSGILTADRFFASIVSVLIMTFTQELIRISESSSAATVLLITLGSFRPVGKDLLALFVGITATALFGELIRHMRMGQSEPNRFL